LLYTGTACVVGATEDLEEADMKAERNHALWFGAALMAAASLAVPTGAAVGTAGSCPVVTSTATVEDGYPSRLSSLYGVDIRTGRHECFERVVVEFGGTGELPGYRVGYQADPILDSPRGAPVDIAGDATLVISFGAWMPTMEGQGYSGAREFVPTNVVSILELEQLENFEGMSQWAIGLDRQRPFEVFTLSEPVRIVVDIAIDGATAPSTSPAATTPATTTPGAPPSSLPPTR
jgi:hypothetical protein